jgi:hypothetical protein
VINTGTIALQRVAIRRPAQSLIMVGLRGVGKTVLLNKLRDIAEVAKYKAMLVEAHEGKSLPELVLPSLRGIPYSLSLVENAKDKARRALRGLKGLVNALNIKVNEIDIGLSIDPEKGLADSGDIEADLPALMVAVGEAARDAGIPVAILVDEMQYLSPKEFSALIMSIHQVNQREVPVVLIGAGLPQIHGLAGNSKSYAERLFRFPDIGALDHDDAIAAIANPAKVEGVSFDDKAIERILELIERYPYFLQQWAYEAWNASESEIISVETVVMATKLAIQELDKSFFKVRFDRCTPSEKKYMRALAEFGQGKHRSGDIAEELGVKTTSVAPTRSALIKKGMIYSPAHGDTAFTVPLFDQYMRRVMPWSGASPSPRAASLV